MKNLLFRSFTLVMIVLLFVSCGKKPSNVLDGVQVQSQTINDDVWLSFSANLNLGSMSFGSISVPVLHPKGQTPIGQLELTSALGGVNQLKISVNVSELAGLNMTTATLPNGNMIPLIANNQVISVNVGRGAKIYLAISESVTAIGVAVPISAFDNIGSKLPGLNFFPIVNKGDVIGTAGIFTGQKSGQNGIAVVADVSRVVNIGKALDLSSPMPLIQSQLAQSEIQLDYSSHATSSAKKAKLDKMIYSLNAKRTVLKMK